MFKMVIRIILVFSLISLSGCITPLTGVQQCALIGEVYQGSAVGSQTRVYNPVCRVPQNNAEQERIEKVRPEAKAISSKNRRNTVLTYVGSIVGGIILAIIIVAGIDSKYRR